jgi:SAM-dependent methyltransferase
VQVDNSGILCAPKKSCENCGSRGAAFHDRLRDYLFGSPGEWTLLRCPAAGCGLVWLDPQPLPDQLSKLYAHYYTHGDSQLAASAVASYKSTGTRRLLKSALSRVFFWKRDIYRSDYLHLQSMPPGRLLEVGCGSGEFLAAAAQRGWQSFGLDFDSAAVERAGKRAGVQADVGELVERRYANGFFDAIVMNNVIEHVWNPKQTLAECRRILRPGGRLVMITPNSESLGQKLFGRNWRGLEPPRHLYVYNSRALQGLCRHAGFARLQVGSSPGGGAGFELFAASMRIAGSAGDPLTARPEQFGRVLRTENVLSLLGWTVGEWLVVIAG